MAGLFIFGVTVTIITLGSILNAKPTMHKVFLCIFCVWFVGILMILAKNIGANETPDFKYVPAEVIAYNATSTYFGTENGDIFYIQSNKGWPDDVPYLLGMDTKGTADVKDDEIITVWRVCD